MTLDEIRNEIDQIDSKLLDLFARRMQAVETVAQIKKEQELPIFRPARENEMIERLKSMVPAKYYHYSVCLYKYLMELSKNCQREAIASDGEQNRYFQQIMRKADTELAAPRVTVQGVKGAFSMSGALAMYPKAKLDFVERWEDVLDAVAVGSCDYGVLPVENSSAGSVTEVYDLLIKNQYFIVKAMAVPIAPCLLGLRGAKISDIRYVYSNYHAFPQCSEFFQNYPKINWLSYPNTAAAAEFVANERKPEFAAIASRECAYLYGLEILADSIQNVGSNCTRFISVSCRPEIADNANKISLVFTLPHVTGSLYRTLSRFAMAGLNLTKIESRPNPEKNFEYYFYVDFTGSVKSPNTLNLLSALEEELPTFSFLGNYNEPEK